MKKIGIKIYSSEYEEDLKDLLVELQVHLASLDERGVLVLKEGYRDGYFDFLMKECDAHEGKIFLAVSDGKAVGAVVVKIFCGGEEDELVTSCPKIGFISDLVVTNKFRSMGIGTRLIESAESYFREKECDYTQLQVFAPNERAFDLYKKLGFDTTLYYLSKKTKKH